MINSSVGASLNHFIFPIDPQAIFCFPFSGKNDIHFSFVLIIAIVPYSPNKSECVPVSINVKTNISSFIRYTNSQSD